MRELWRCLCTRWLPLNVPVDGDHGAIVLLVRSQCRGSGCLGQEYETEQTIWTSHNLTTNDVCCLFDKCRIAMDCSVLLCCILCELLYDSSRGEGPIWLLITRNLDVTCLFRMLVAVLTGCCFCFSGSRAKLWALIFQRRSTSMSLVCA